MRTLDVRRHSLTRKGKGRGFGSHLSQEGVRLARAIGEASGPFDLVVVSPEPRTLETAIAMGYAVDEIADGLGPADPDLFREVGHHDRWSWPEPFAAFARLIDGGGDTARLSRIVADCFRETFRRLPEDGRALAISHGRVIECGAIALARREEIATWGAPFQHGEGVRITERGESFDVAILRVDAARSW
jgi:broad specificity phosphatase PhoE